MTIRLYDTMARAKREFVPREAERITMYVCGPTVYGRAHIGNARPAVVFDTLRRLLEHEFPERKIVYARNVTDVDDKIIAAAEAEGVEPREIAVRYEQYYLQDMDALGVGRPDFAPHATGFVDQMIDMIQRLIDGGFAYEAKSHVLFEVAKDPQYGLLSRRDPDAIRAGARVEVAPFKRDPADFVLWKPSPDSMIGWDSPWGRGRPGWHIECSAMIEAFGTRKDAGNVETIDIHGGGLDLIFPHHENEIAQSRCAHGGAPLANYWIHNGFVDMGAEKMSKSLGNVVTVDQLLGAGHRGEVLRLALLSAHYRSPLPWTESLIAQSKATLDRWYRGYERFILDYDPADFDPHPNVMEALADDMNTPAAIGAISAGLKGVTVDPGKVFTIKTETGQWFAAAKFMGFLIENARTWFQGGGGDAAIDAHIAKRNAAKARKDFATADRIRDELKAEGILLEDGPSGTTWRRA